MKRDRPINVPASIRQRLLNLARERGRVFEQVLVRYALERLLYRISRSPHVDRFVLKGALLLELWLDLPQRPTRDADFLASGDPEPDGLRAIFQELARMTGEGIDDDGLRFLADTVQAKPIRKDAGSSGVRVTLEAELARARIPVQCDMGFGDAVTPSPRVEAFPTLLDLPAPRLRVYPRETVLAEKLEAMVKLAEFNSRMKDYFDLWALLREGKLDHISAASALRATFARRGTALPVELPPGLTDPFAAENERMWAAFLRRSTLEAPPFAEVMVVVRDGAWPLLSAAAKGVG